MSSQFDVDREHYNKSKEAYLKYAKTKCTTSWEHQFVDSLIQKYIDYGSSINISGKQRQILERISGKSWRWKIWGATDKIIINGETTWI